MFKGLRIGALCARSSENKNNNNTNEMKNISRIRASFSSFHSPVILFVRIFAC